MARKSASPVPLEPSPEPVDWEAIERALPVAKGQAGRAARKKLFDVCDRNHNGILCLSEVSAGLQCDLKIPSIRDLAPAFQLAFQAARDFEAPVANFHADYIDCNKFRILLIYLKHYFELWQFFLTLDTSGDRRITIAEFQSHLSLFKDWGLPDVASWEKDPQEAFNKIDSNGNGIIIFDEFANYCIRSGLHKLGASDDEEEALERQAALDILKQKQPSVYNDKTLAVGGSAVASPGSRPPSQGGGSPHPGGRARSPDGSRLPDTGLGDAFSIAISNLVSPDEDVQEYLQATLCPILTPAIEALLHHVHDTGEMQKALKQLQDDCRQPRHVDGASRSRSGKAGAVVEEANGKGGDQGDISSFDELPPAEAEEIGFDPLVWLSEALRQHAKGPTDKYRPGIEERIAELAKKREEEETLLAQQLADQEAEEAAAEADGF